MCKQKDAVDTNACGCYESCAVKMLFKTATDGGGKMEVKTVTVKKSEGRHKHEQKHKHKTDKHIWVYC